jgi:hypothetical protein
MVCFEIVNGISSVLIAEAYSPIAVIPRKNNIISIAINVNQADSPITI